MDPNDLGGHPSTLVVYNQVGEHALLHEERFIQWPMGLLGSSGWLIILHSITKEGKRDDVTDKSIVLQQQGVILGSAGMDWPTTVPHSTFPPQ